MNPRGASKHEQRAMVFAMAADHSKFLQFLMRRAVDWSEEAEEENLPPYDGANAEEAVYEARFPRIEGHGGAMMEASPMETRGRTAAESRRDRRSMSSQFPASASEHWRLPGFSSSPRGATFDATSTAAGIYVDERRRRSLSDVAASSEESLLTPRTRAASQESAAVWHGGRRERLEYAPQLAPAHAPRHDQGTASRGVALAPAPPKTPVPSRFTPALRRQSVESHSDSRIMAAARPTGDQRKCRRHSHDTIAFDQERAYLSRPSPRPSPCQTPRPKLKSLDVQSLDESRYVAKPKIAAAPRRGDSAAVAPIEAPVRVPVPAPAASPEAAPPSHAATVARTALVTPLSSSPAARVLHPRTPDSASEVSTSASCVSPWQPESPFGGAGPPVSATPPKQPETPKGPGERDSPPRVRRSLESP